MSDLVNVPAALGYVEVDTIDTVDTLALAAYLNLVSHHVVTAP